MTAILCGAAAVAPDECVGCGGWLHWERPGGYRPAGPGGFGYCTEDCITDHQRRIGQVDAASHLRVRDLLCDCPRVRAPAGLPSATDRAEWAAYQRTQGE